MPFLYPSSFTSIFLLVASLLASTSMVVAAEDVCAPAVDVEISIPYECPYNNFVNGVCFTPTQIADKLVQAVFVDFDVEAARELMAEDYIQHYPFVPTGAAPVLGLIPLLPDSGLAIETHRTIAEGNLVAYHSTYTNATLFGGETLIAFDVFRVEDGKVQEHWDNLQELDGPNPSGRTMTDGPTMIKYLGQTMANKALGTNMVQNVLIEGNLSSVPEFLSTVSYTQHNPSIADGLDGLAAGLEALAAQGLTIVYDSVELVVAEGNFVLIGSLGSLGENNPTAYYDLFRMEDGLIVEHWDVLQAVPPDDQFAHSNGKF